jgi:hypothetical protein
MAGGSAYRSSVEQSKTAGDRRGSPRYIMSLPVSFRLYPSDENSIVHSGDLINISWCGAYFFTESWLELGTELALTISFPSKRTPSSPILARAKARVVRSEEAWDEEARKVGAAAVLEPFLL